MFLSIEGLHTSWSQKIGVRFVVLFLLLCCVHSSIAAPNAYELTPVPEPECCPCYLGGQFTSCWTASAEALFLQRGTSDSLGLLYEESSDEGLGRQIFNAKNLDFDFEVGPRVRLQRALGCGQSIELSYFGITGWNSSASFGPGDYLLIGDASRSGPQVNTANFNYDSELHTVELNFLGTPETWFQPIMGLRWLQLDENYRVSGVADFGAPVNYVLDYDTENNLFGGQIGALLNFWNRGGPLTISGIGKAGLYANHATNRGTFVADFIDFGGDGDTTRAAFVGELGINAKYRLSCHWSVTAGYQALWLGGVALASNQVAYTDIADQTGGVSTEGDVFYHGANVGLEARW